MLPLASGPYGTAPPTHDPRLEAPPLHQFSPTLVVVFAEQALAVVDVTPSALAPAPTSIDPTQLFITGLIELPTG